MAPAELDKSLALRLLSSEASGIYSADSRVVGALALPATAIILSALPRMFQMTNAKHVAPSYC
jgi:O-antigen/teichoic acid export membrane protein